MKTYALRCIAPDGEIKTESNAFPSIRAAWQRADDMGSRWFFYPINVVTGPTRALARARIVAVPHGVPSAWVGKTLGKLARACAVNSQHAADYCNGLTPFCVYP